MQSQPSPTPRETVPTPAPRPAARARKLRRPRHPRLHPTRDPRTEWRGRDTSWTSLPWPVLLASLPETARIPFTNERGATHPFESAVALEWPANGMLTNAERRAWNRRPLTATDSGRTVHLPEIASALHDTLDDSFLRTPKHWDAGSTTLGEWWALRARYPQPPERDAGRAPLEIAITVQHAIGSADVLAHGGLRLPGTGAEIVTGMYYARLRNGRITLPNNRGYDLITTLAQQARSTAAVLASWTEEALLRPALATWAGTIATPVFGHTTAARLVALHDRHRFSKTSAADERPAPMETACDVAWTLANHLRSVPEITTRIDRQQRIIEAVGELCWWNEHDETAHAGAALVH